MGFFSSIDKALFGGPGEVGGLIGGPSIRAMESIGEVAKVAITATLDTTVDAVDYCKEKPVQATLITTAAVATGATAYVVAKATAPAIAMAVAKTGVFGKTATTGTAIKTLNGAALKSASLAKIGGGSLKTGGGGIVKGVNTIANTASATTGTTTGIVGKECS